MEVFIDSFGYKIYTKVEGSGRTIVLLHCLWGSQVLFDNLTEILRPGYQVIRIDFPGHGKSPSPAKDFTFQEFALILHEILNQLHCEGKVGLIGHSMGGFAALAYARQYPEKISSLVLIHTLVGGPNHKSIRHRLRQTELIRRNRRRLLLQVANESNFAPGNAEKFDTQFKQIDDLSDQVTDEGAIAAIHAINTRENSLPFLMSAKIPTLMVIGRKDRVYNPEEQMWEYENIPGAEVLILNNSGHFGFFEEESLFKERIIAFLSKLKY